MPKDNALKKVLIIGSGPIVIGQAAEFDYAGTQACKAIMEEGIETVLINSNPATIMTDEGIVDKVYMEPITEEAVTEIIKKEKPQGVLAGFGGQTGLNIAMELEEKGVFKRYGVKLLGVNRDSIHKAEDRDAFKSLMQEINEFTPDSMIATDINECSEFVEEIGYPLIIRPAYTLGGTGGGIAYNGEDFKKHCKSGIEKSAIGQILVEKSIEGWKEIEYEVIRDSKDNCIIICSMENLDPAGIHTGDSIVVAPTQTLNDTQYQMLRDASLKIIRSLKIEGGCNVQFAMNPDKDEYIVIEVNPRVSRSSALASKAAGYPIAKIAAKIAIGYTLDELKNYVTEGSSACFEPTLDYCVVKIPKWPFDKFRTASRKLGTQMKATGEIMAIDRNFESALLKAVDSLEIEGYGLRVPYVSKLNDEKLMKKLYACDDERIFCIAEAFRRNLVTVDEIFDKTKIDRWYLYKVLNIVEIERALENSEVTNELIYEAESKGFSDEEIMGLSGVKRDELQDIRVYHDIYPVYKVVDTCAGEFEALTPYYYSSYGGENESVKTEKDKVLVVGSGPIRIGQGIEFDYCCVQGVWALKELGYESIIINNNPETVSTDFDIADKLYFEPLHTDDVMNVIKNERPKGVILQFGGQTSLNLSSKLAARSINILGTKNKYIDLAENREKFSELLGDLGIAIPKGYSVRTKEEAFAASKELGYPLMVRPSFVIGGRAMQVVYNDDELFKYLKEAVKLSDEYPVLIDKYVEGVEMDVDAIADGEDVLIPGIMEHFEKTGVHSGDSCTCYPPYDLPKYVIEELVSHTKKIVKALNIVGLVNIQYALDGDKLYVIEVNPRASRTIPILSKVTKVPMVKIAVRTMLGEKLKDMKWGTGLYQEQDYYAVKIPVFSDAKLTDVDVAVGPEMKSTGEVLGVDKDLKTAVYKGFLGIGTNIPTEGGIFVSLKEPDKNMESFDVIKAYANLGFLVYTSSGTGEYLKSYGIDAKIISRESAKSMIGENIKIVINTPKAINSIETDSFDIRRAAIERNLPVLTSMDTAKLFTYAVSLKKKGKKLDYKTL